MSFQIINTEETISRLIALIRDAKERVTLVSPYVTLAGEDRVGRVIREALAKKVIVNVIFRLDAHTPPKEAFFESMKPHLEAGLNLFSMEGLHAKVYVSDAAALVTSLNLLASSFLNSVEIGMWSQDPKDIADLKDYLKQQVVPHLTPWQLKSAAKKQQTKPPQARAASTGRHADEGHCIRCGDGVAFNPARPYCRDDYEEWAEWANEDYKDSFCHGCGDEHPATMRRPLCPDCYRKAA